MVEDREEREGMGRVRPEGIVFGREKTEEEEQADAAWERENLQSTPPSLPSQQPPTIQPERRPSTPPSPSAALQRKAEIDANFRESMKLESTLLPAKVRMSES